jgi:hypothetical protein
VLELEGQCEFFDSFLISGGEPPPDSAGDWHLKCLRTATVGPRWRAVRVRNYVDVRGFERVAEPAGWVVLRDQRGKLLAVGAAGELVELSHARGKPARELEEGFVFRRLEETFHLELEDQAAIVEMQRTLEETSVYPVSAVLAVLGIADRVVHEVALEDAKFRFDKDMRELWTRNSVSASCEYGVFMPRALEPYMRGN